MGSRPALHLLAINNQRPHLRDVVAGVSVAFLLVPQALAYAEIAGMPPTAGLFAAAVPPVVAALFASSRYLQTGPVAMTGLLTYGALVRLAEPGSAEYIGLAGLLAVMVGLLRLAMGLLRAGRVSYLMSQPVLLGFTSGAALLIVASQVPTLLGVEGRRTEGLLLRAVHAADAPESWNLTAMMIGAGIIGLIIVGKRLNPAIPVVLLSVVAGLGVSLLVDFGGPVLGMIGGSLPAVSIDLPWTHIRELVVPAGIIALIGFAEPASIARTFAAADRSPWNPDRELVAQGFANLAAGITGAFPTGGSFGRTAVAKLSGARSPWTGAVAGLTVMAFLPVATILDRLPRAVLAGIVIAAVGPLIRVASLIRVYRHSRPQAAVGWLTFAATLALSPRVDIGILIGIGAAVAVHLARELRIRVDHHRVGESLVVRPEGVLYFGSAPDLADRLIHLLSESAEAQELVLDLRELGRIDYTGAVALRTVVDDARRAGMKVRVDAVPGHARRILGRVWADDPDLVRQLSGPGSVSAP